MDRLAQRRRQLRPHGRPASSCQTCALYERCGGIETAPALFDSCFDQHCCGRADCDLVCPHNAHFKKDMRELRGLRFETMAPLLQRECSLPKYVPLIHHPYSRRAALAWPVVALDTYTAFKLKKGVYTAIAHDSAALRYAFRLESATRVILRGTANDPDLERYWSFRRRDRVPEQMARLGVEQVVGPNFSHFLDVPRTETLANRMRQLLCLEEMQRAGLSPIPHLSAAQTADWRFWKEFLRRSPSVRLVAVEFETGNRTPTEGVKVVDHLAGIQEALGRPLHLLAIGGAQFTEDIARRLGSFTVIDSNPFIKTVKRQAFAGGDESVTWRPQPTAPGQPIDDLLAANLTAYSGWVEERADRGRVRMGGRLSLPVYQGRN